MTSIKILPFFICHWICGSSWTIQTVLYGTLSNLQHWEGHDEQGGLLVTCADTQSVSDLIRPEWSFSLSLNSLWYIGEKNNKYFHHYSTRINL